MDMNISKVQNLMIPRWEKSKLLLQLLVGRNEILCSNWNNVQNPHLGGGGEDKAHQKGYGSLQGAKFDDTQMRKIQAFTSIACG